MTDLPPPPALREPFTAVLVSEAAMAGPAMDALDLAGGRLLCRVAWDAVPEKLGTQAGRPVILVETEGVAEPLLAAMLPRIDSIARALDLPVIAVLDERGIDVVSASLFGPHVQPLVSPTLAERVTALAVANGSREVLKHDSWREGESARLQRLNQEVARIAEVLSRLTRREGLPPTAATSGEVEDRRQGYDAGRAGVVDTPIDPADLRRVIRARRLRDQFLGVGLFEDPAWDMMLDLFAAEIEGVQVSVSSLCIAAAVAPTTALRWIGKLTDAGLFVREADPFDRRRAFMALSPRASEGMRGYLAAIRRAGLAIA
jgi:hypothetical protein